jgi:DNA-binding HxlR family transcriptional regulator
MKSGDSSPRSGSGKGVRPQGAPAPRGCPLAQIIDRVGDKWTVLVVGYLSEHPIVRFNALMRAIPGVSHRMLTLTLRGLERDGLVKRTPYATVPPRVEYELTELGRSLRKPLSLLAKWASAQRAEIEAAQRRYDLLRPQG